MEANGIHLCIGCMQRLDEQGECNHCHMEQESYNPIPRCLLPGTMLAERYMLGKVLGEGSFGITYIGWDCLLELPVAIKEYYPSDLVSRDVIRGTDKNVYVYEKLGNEEYQENLKKFLNEAKCLTRFNQKGGIVSVRDFFYENNTAYIVMEYVDGGNVKDYIKKHGKMSAKQVLKIMHPVLKAIASVHNTGMVHRDISPDNLLFNKEGQLVLIDFGSARVRNVEVTRSMTVVFKRGFSPEEQYRSRGKQGAWSDVYALCTTMYFMLTGNTPEESVERALGADTISLETMKDIELSDKQKKAIMKGMSVKAEERYQNVKALMDDLYGEEVPPSDMKKLPVPKRKWKVLPWIIAGSALLILGAIGLSTTLFKQDVQSPVTSEIETTPSPTPVTVTPSPKPKTYTMVSLVGKTQKQAKKEIEKMGDETLTIKWKKEFSNKVKKGKVIRQSIKKGTRWQEGKKQALTIIVSKGKEKVTVPAVIGKQYEKAKETLQKKKLKIQLEWVHDDAGYGTVIGQSKTSGTKVVIKSVVKLTISKGPEAVETPKPETTDEKKPADDGFAGIIA